MNKTVSIRSQARRAALTKTAESGGATLQKQAQRLKLLAGAARAAGVRKALAAGKVVLPSAPPLKELILGRVAGLRGQRSLAWPLPAYPGRAGRAKGLLDYESHLWRTGDWGRTMRDGETLRLYDARLLRQLNGDRSARGRQLSDALHAATVTHKHEPVGLDLSPLVAKKKAEAAAYAEGFRKAAELAGVDPDALYKQAMGVPGRVLSALGRVVRGGRAVRGGLQRGVARYKDLLNGTTASKYQKQVSSMDRLMGKMQGAGRNSVTLGTPQQEVWSRAFTQRQNALHRLEGENFLGGLARTGAVAGVAAAPALAAAGLRNRWANKYKRAYGYGQVPQAAQDA